MRSALLLISVILSPAWSFLQSGKYQSIYFPMKKEITRHCTMLADALPTENDLLIVGAGYMGGILGTKWLEIYREEGVQVYAETRTNRSHEILQRLGLTPMLRKERSNDRKFPNVVFCAAPGGNEDYPGEVAAACELWDGSGNLVFTSSAGVYAENSGGEVTEGSPTQETARTQKLLQSEAHVLAKGGCVVRLAGLYDLERGAHNYWLSQPALSSNPRGLINMIHYEDAAGITIAALKRGEPGQIYAGADGVPFSRADICKIALQSKTFKDKVAPSFPDESAEMEGKIINNSYTREKLQWTPIYSSFETYMASN